MKRKRKLRLQDHFVVAPGEEVDEVLPETQQGNACRNCVHWSSINRPVSEEGGCTALHSAWYEETTQRRHLCGDYEWMSGDYSLYDRRPETDPEPETEITIGPTIAPRCRVCVHWVPEGRRADAGGGRCTNTGSASHNWRTIPTTMCSVFQRYAPSLGDVPSHVTGEDTAPQPARCGDCIYHYRAGFPGREEPEHKCWHVDSAVCEEVVPSNTLACNHFTVRGEGETDDLPPNCTDCFNCYEDDAVSGQRCHCAESIFYRDLRDYTDATCQFFDDDEEDRP